MRSPKVVFVFSVSVFVLAAAWGKYGEFDHDDGEKQQSPEGKTQERRTSHPPTVTDPLPSSDFKAFLVVF